MADSTDWTDWTDSTRLAGPMAPQARIRRRVRFAAVNWHLATTGLAYIINMSKIPQARPHPESCTRGAAQGSALSTMDDPSHTRRNI